MPALHNEASAETASAFAEHCCGDSSPKPYQFDAVPKLINESVSTVYQPSFSPGLTQLKYFHTWHLHELPLLWAPLPIHHTSHTFRILGVTIQELVEKQWKATFEDTEKRPLCSLFTKQSCICKEQNSVPVMNERHFLKTRPLYFKTGYYSLLLFASVFGLM